MAERWSGHRQNLRLGVEKRLESAWRREMIGDQKPTTVEGKAIWGIPDHVVLARQCLGRSCSMPQGIQGAE